VGIKLKLCGSGELDENAKNEKKQNRVDWIMKKHLFWLGIVLIVVTAIS
jgi:hypothetical protein